MQYISVKNWDSMQHYKDRNPPWIKLHRDLLYDYEFARLKDACKSHLMLIWLLASQLDNKIPNDSKWIAKRIGCTTKIDISLLIDKGFLVVDSRVQAECKRTAIAEAEAEAEAETETEERESKPRKRSTQLPDNWTLPEDYKEYCQTKRPELKPEVVAENFKDYHLSVGKPMADWKRTWQRWVRNEHGTTRKAGNGTSAGIVQTPADRHAEAVRRRQDSDPLVG
jgi:hypothetical protein